MNRNYKIILLFLSTIISVLMILMSYYGVDRYIIMHLNSMENYMSKYKNLSPLPGKVIVSFTTNEDKMNKMKPMLNSILDQTVKVNKIDMNLPPKKTDYVIPKKYKDMCSIYHIGKDYGSANNLIPVLLRSKDKGTKIIFLNDEVVYGKDFFEQIINESDKYPNNAILNYKNNNICAGIVKPEFFSLDVIDNNKKYFDDEWIKSHLLNNPIKFNYIENYKTI
jgi:hypothetical protein